MKIYKHEGNGHWIGSCVVVVAECKVEAETIIRNELDKSGLPNEPLNITEHEIETNTIIYFNNGDY